MKRLIGSAMLSLLCILALSASAFAQPPRHGGPDGPGGGPGGHGDHEMMAPMPGEQHPGALLDRLERLLPPEVRESAKTILMEHRTAMYPLNERIQSRRHELNALLATPGTSDEAIKKLVEEINGLQADKFRADVTMRKEFFKATGVPLPDRPRLGRM